MKTLPKAHQQKLVNEMRFAAKKMREEISPHKQIYFFSAVFGELIRTLNWTWDRERALTKQVTEATHRQIGDTLRKNQTREEKAIFVPDIIFTLLAQTTDDLADYFDTQEGSLCEILGRFSELSYATAGNGYYLMEKGDLTLTIEED